MRDADYQEEEQENTSSPNWLETVQSITTGDRRRDYGHPLYNFARIALRWTNHLNIPITPLDVAIMNIEMKLARHENTFKEDNFVDIIGYTVCIQSMDEELKRLGYLRGIRMFEDTYTEQGLRTQLLTILNQEHDDQTD